MIESVGAQLSHAEPFDVQTGDAALGEIDAADLLVGCGFPVRIVAIHGEMHGHARRGFVRLVKQRRNPQAGQDFIAQLPDVIAGPAFDDVEPFNLRFRIAPLSGKGTPEDDLLQRIPAHLIGKCLPLREVFHHRHARHFGLAVVLRLGDRQAAGKDRMLQQCVEITRWCLRHQGKAEGEE